MTNTAWKGKEKEKGEEKKSEDEKDQCAFSKTTGKSSWHTS